MHSLAITADTSDGYLTTSGNATHTAASDGTGAGLSGNTDRMLVGHERSSGLYYAHQSFLRFNLGLLPGGAIITAATLELSASFARGVTSAFDIRLRRYDWSPALAAANWRTKAQSAALTSCGSLNMTNLAGRYGFTVPASSLAAGQYNGILVTSAPVEDDTSGDLPGGADYNYWAFDPADDGTPANRPILTVTYLLPAPGLMMVSD